MTFVVIRFCVALPVLMVWYRLSGGRWLPRRQALGLALTSLVGSVFVGRAVRRHAAGLCVKCRVNYQRHPCVHHPIRLPAFA